MAVAVRRAWRLSWLLVTLAFQDSAAATAAAFARVVRKTST